MKIVSFVWLDEVIEKLESKHNVLQDELILSARDMTPSERSRYERS
jgi:hypothetical protein